MIIKDKSSESEALFNAEVKIICFTLVSVTVNHSKVLKLFSFSSIFFIMSEEGNISSLKDRAFIRKIYSSFIIKLNRWKFLCSFKLYKFICSINIFVLCLLMKLMSAVIFCLSDSLKVVNSCSRKFLLQYFTFLSLLVSFSNRH